MTTQELAFAEIERLVRSFKDMPAAQIDEAVLRLLNRLIFIRTAEDREVEDNRLRTLVRVLRDKKQINRLDRERLTNWGARLPTRVLIRIMIAHDLYHAGEINHIRVLLQGNDRWPYK